MIRELIVDKDPPDTTRLTAPGNVARLRADLEAHALLDLPWDDIFGPVERALGIDSTELPEEEPADDDDDDEATDSDASPAPAAAGKDDDAVYDGDGSELFECEKCKGTMRGDEYTCKHCGAEYDPDTGELVPEVEKTPPKRRSRAAAAKQAKGSTAAAAPPKPSSRSSATWPSR